MPQITNETWAEWWPKMYKDLEKPTMYPGDNESYILAGGFLAGDEQVEEWGCATTWGRQFIPAPYRGVDGAQSEFADLITDLSEYRSTTPNALIRHVLEHNWNWRTILNNFLDSFQKRGVVVLFIPLGLYDINRSFENRVGEPPSPPGLQMDEASFLNMLNRRDISIVKDFELQNATPPFGYERVFFLEKVEEHDTVAGDLMPRCFRCNQYGFQQLRANFELLDRRYEIAYNACGRCLEEGLDTLYGFETFPMVSI